MVSPWATGLKGRGLADPVWFRLTWPLPPPLPGRAASNKVFPLRPVGMVSSVMGASWSHLPPLGLLKAGLSAPHCSLGSPGSPHACWVSEGKLALRGQGLGSEPRGRVWLEPTLLLLSERFGGWRNKWRQSQIAWRWKGTSQLWPSPPLQSKRVAARGHGGSQKKCQSRYVYYLLDVTRPQPFNAYNHPAWKLRLREVKSLAHGHTVSDKAKG